MDKNRGALFTSPQWLSPTLSCSMTGSLIVSKKELRGGFWSWSGLWTTPTLGVKPKQNFGSFQKGAVAKEFVVCLVVFGREFVEVPNIIGTSTTLGSVMVVSQTVSLGSPHWGSPPTLYYKREIPQKGITRLLFIRV